MNKDNAVLDNLILNLRDKSEISIYQTLPKGYIVLNPNGIILGYNSKYKELIGLTGHEGSSKSMKNFLIGKNKKKFMTLLEYVQLKGSIDDFELEITTQRGQTKIVWISATAIYDSNKKVIALHCLISDMTKVKMYLKQIKDELKNLNNFNEKDEIKAIYNTVNIIEC